MMWSRHNHGVHIVFLLLGCGLTRALTVCCPNGAARLQSEPQAGGNTVQCDVRWHWAVPEKSIPFLETSVALVAAGLGLDNSGLQAREEPVRKLPTVGESPR